MLKNYLSKLFGKEITVLGAGVSNLPLIGLLLDAGAKVTVRDKKTFSALGQTAVDLKARGVTLILGEDYLEDLPPHLTFCTPGINPNRPEIAAARQKGAEITSEMGLFLDLCKAKVIGITGSEGKTTTTTLIAEMLKAEGHKVWLGGNIGTPLLSHTDEMTQSDYAVIELSSFQLMLTKKSPHIAVITNITPNHLDVHTDMDEYISAKEAIFAFQGKDDIAVFNADNEITARAAKKAPGVSRLFSMKSQPEEGVWHQGGDIFINGEKIMPSADIFLLGDHNIENYMAAFAALSGIVSSKNMAHVARTFKGIEHRLEFVRELDGVKYINDSIASSPTRAIAGLKCFDSNIILIAGGSDKNIPFDILGQEIVSRVKTLLLCGATAQKIETATRLAPGYSKGRPEIIHFSRLQDLISALPSLASPGDTVLFSPACASFDQFENFHERGRFFKNAVLNL